MAAERQLCLPLLGTPDPRLAIPSAGHQILAARDNIDGADIVGVADEKTFGVIGAGCVG